MPLLSEAEAVRLLTSRPGVLRKVGLGRALRLRPLPLGEYHQNFVVEDELPAPPVVLRINFGSQMGLANQLAYEAEALRLLEPCRIAPRLIHLEETEEESDDPPFLLEEFIPGRPLDYARDLEAAAHLFGRLHTFPVERHHLVRSEAPFRTLLDDAAGLLAEARQAGAVAPAAMQRLAGAHERLSDRAGHWQAHIDRIGLAVVNTEVNSGNFLVDDPAGTIRLVDWEKPLYSSPMVDIGHFWALSTILWKGEHVPGDAERRRFLEVYGGYYGPEAVAAVREVFDAAVQYSALRGIAWCASVYAAYRDEEKELASPHTFARIQQYLQPDFLDMVFPS